MENLIINILTIDDTLNIMLIIFISFLGSISKDYLKVLDNPIKKFNMMEAFLSTITASITIYSFSDFIVKYIGIKGLVFSSFLVGLIGFELLNQLSTLTIYVKKKAVISTPTVKAEDNKPTDETIKKPEASE